MFSHIVLEERSVKKKGRRGEKEKGRIICLFANAVFRNFSFDQIKSNLPVSSSPFLSFSYSSPLLPFPLSPFLNKF
jgi:hypothetical protein